MEVLNANLSHAQRVSLATLVTMAAVSALEAAHFSSGTSLVLEMGYFVIPALVALAFFTASRERALAFVFLTLVGLLAAAAAIDFHLTH
jgi:hypothetical protein